MKQTISVIGLGFIGLPLALSYCEKGIRVIGVDNDATKVDRLVQGDTNVHEPCGERHLRDLLKKHVQTNMFVPTTSVEEASRETAIYFVTVGIPVRQVGELDFQPLMTATKDLARVLKRNDLVLFRSTVPPGTMERRILPLLEQESHMKAGTDFHLAYAAERVAEGSAMQEFQTMDVVLGGMTPQCAAKASEWLRKLTQGTIHITDLRTAQTVKVIENAQRDVGIALTQEIAGFADRHGIDVYELIRLANTHPRVHLLQPGIGVGGYCIPNALAYMRGSLPSEYELPVFELARRMNDETPKRIVDGVALRLRDVGKSLAGSTIAVLGLGMKDNSSDLRQSPAVAVVEELESRGAVVRAYDPLVPLQFPYQAKTIKECLYGADGLVVAAWQDSFDSLDMTDALKVSDLRGVVVDLKSRLSRYAEWTSPSSAVFE